MLMRRDGRTMRRLPAVASVFLATFAAGAGACAPAAADRPSDRVRIATGSEGGIYHAIGTALASAYAGTLPGVDASAHATAASAYNVNAVETDEAELAFALGDVAYLAYTQGTLSLPRPHSGLRAIAVLYQNVMHILVRTDSNIRDVSDLHGHRVAAGRSLPMAGGARSVNVDVIAAAYGLDSGDFASEWLILPELLAGLRDGHLAAGFFSSGYPVRAIAEAADEFGLRLLPVTRDAAIRVRDKHPFFKQTVVPAMTYPAQTSDIPALGVDNLLICRDDLADELVYRLTRSFFESLSAIGRDIVAARLVDIDRAPTTPIPLHPGAARYYRERELLRW